VRGGPISIIQQIKLMRKHLLSLCYLVILLSELFLNTSIMNAESRKPKDVNAISLAKRDEFEPQQVEILDAAVVHLQKANEPIGDYYAEVDKTPKDGMTIIHLWHKSAFDSSETIVMGNPGGKSRDLFYDSKKGEIVKSLFWQ